MGATNCPYAEIPRYTCRRTPTTASLDGDLDKPFWRDVEQTPVFAVRVDGVLNDRHLVDRGWTAEIALPWSGMKLLDDKEVLPPRSGTELRVELGRTEVVEGPGSSATALWTWARHGSGDLHIPECYPVITLSRE